MRKTNEQINEEIRDICTYQADEGTAGYNLSEEQFEKLQNLIVKIRQEDKEPYIVTEIHDDAGMTTDGQKLYWAKVRKNN